MTTIKKTSLRLVSLALAVLSIGFIPFTTTLAQELIQDSDSGLNSGVIEETIQSQRSTYQVVTEKLSSDIAIGDFVVGPGRVEMEIKPGESKTVEIFVSNRISNDRLFELSVEDVSGSRDGRQAVVLLGNERGPYTIKDYISFPVESFPLSLGERARIPVTVTIPPNAEPGGYYGSVLVSTTQTNDAVVEAVAQSPIVARIGTLFFVRVPGVSVTSGQSQSISISPAKLWHESGPINFNILFENTGSVHLNPYGELRIRNLFGEEVGYVQLEPWFALPQSLRSREVTWDREVLFGRYTATAFINRGYDDVVDEVSVTFYVLPWKMVSGVFLVVFVIVFGFRFIFRNFEFKRRGK